MLRGRDVRHYRKLIGLNQEEFARRLGMRQPALSLLETGRLAVTDEHRDKLLKVFDRPEWKPRFGEYLKKIETEESQPQPALTAPLARYATLPCWRSEEYDLGRAPQPDQIAGLVTVRASERPVVALQMSKASKDWVKNDVLVFQQDETGTVEDDELCLLHVQLSKDVAAQTMIATARRTRTERGKILAFKPVEPSGDLFVASDDVVLTCFRLLFRGRYVREP